MRIPSVRTLLFVENYAVFARTVVQEFLAGLEVTVAPGLVEVRRPIAAGPFAAMLVDPERPPGAVPGDIDDGKGDELRARGFVGKIVAVSAHDQGNARLLAAGADAVGPKGRFRRSGVLAAAAR